MPDPRVVERAAFLSNAAIFSELAQDEIAFIAPRAVQRKYDSGELIFNAGDPCPGLYVVETGAVKIYKSSMSGREQILTIDGPGSTIAELPVFDGGPFPASAQAVKDSTLLFISKQDFHALCIAHPQVALKVLRVIGRRLRALVGIIEELSFATVRHRLAAMLLRLAKTGDKTPDGIRVTLPATNQELAAQIGTVRELVSRNMSRLQSEGIIRLDGRNVYIPNVRALQAEVETEE